MDEYKKIDGFTNNASPSTSALFLFEESTGVYYNITKAQLAALLGGTVTLQQVITNSPVVSGTIFQSANGLLLATISNSRLTLKYTNGLSINMVDLSSNSSKLSADDGTNTGIIYAQATSNRLFHSLLNEFAAPNNNFPNEVPSTLVALDASKNLKSLPLATYPSPSELAYVKGVTSDIQTQLNTKAALTPRVTSVASSATPTPNAGTDDEYTITALAANATIGAPTGTPTEGQKLILRIKDNGTARTLAFNAIYRFSSDLAAPTTTVINKTFYLGFIYNATDSKWDNIAQLNNI